MAPSRSSLIKLLLLAVAVQWSVSAVNAAALTTSSSSTPDAGTTTCITFDFPGETDAGTTTDSNGIAVTPVTSTTPGAGTTTDSNGITVTPKAKLFHQVHPQYQYLHRLTQADFDYHEQLPTAELLDDCRLHP
ncbi:hypothetical protein MIND_00804000 [Mycena indigotica]|uniref:Uncharacterized protein n=1 Tax=Mycena indigotica TaxID=2126181 RepID=A0A8H6SFH5_9AGAR|nr:uncharacterized protein MIND_00804000 [Mycena indigotica]KAF7298573.1 hypothetical protein MIND_00804000 [Mycena indigotica]